MDQKPLQPTITTPPKSLLPPVIGYKLLADPRIVYSIYAKRRMMTRKIDRACLLCRAHPVCGQYLTCFILFTATLKPKKAERLLNYINHLHECDFGMAVDTNIQNHDLSREKKMDVTTGLISFSLNIFFYPSLKGMCNGEVVSRSNYDPSGRKSRLTGSGELMERASPRATPYLKSAICLSVS